MCSTAVFSNIYIYRINHYLILCSPKRHLKNFIALCAALQVGATCVSPGACTTKQLQHTPGDLFLIWLHFAPAVRLNDHKKVVVNWRSPPRMCLSRHKHVHVAVKYGWVSWQQSDMFYEDGKNVMLEECEGKKNNHTASPAKATLLYYCSLAPLNPG